MSFGIQGPKGDTGARGPQGATGPQGPTGTSGLNSIELVGDLQGNVPISRSGIKHVLYLTRYNIDSTRDKLQSRGQTLYWSYKNDTWATSSREGVITLALSRSGYFSMSQNGSNNHFYGIALFFS